MVMKIENKERHVSELRKNGITIINDYLDEAKATELYDQIIDSLDSDEFASGDEYDRYSEMATADKPVANERTGTDEGMIDIFNMDAVVKDIEDIKNDPQIIEIINEASGNEWEPTNINTYIRRFVDNPSWFHADSYSKYKSLYI